MTIIEELAKNREIEKILYRISPKDFIQDIKDFAQDLYIYLLTIDEQKLIQLKARNELGYYLLRMCGLSLYSKTGMYERKYNSYNIHKYKFTKNYKY